MDETTRIGRRQLVVRGGGAALTAVALYGTTARARAQEATPTAGTTSADADAPGLNAPRGPNSMPANIGYAAQGPNSPLTPLAFDRRPVGPEDVRIDIKYCGVCHSDVHAVREGSPDGYPVMPGHEMAGIVSEVGSAVTRYAVGDRVGVGTMVFWGSEETRGLPVEQYQSPPPVFTYGSIDPQTGERTFGGYSDEIVVNEHFVLRIPDALPLEAAAPILCAGVTTWSTLRHWDVGPGDTVGVAGIGGLGHMAVQLAKARGADRVIAFTTTPDKTSAVLGLGADEVVAMDDADAIAAHTGSLDYLLTTIPTVFDMRPYVSLVKHDGTLVTVGAFGPTPAEAINLSPLISRRISIAGSMVGSIEETQEVLDFCAQHDVAPEIQIIPIQDVNDAFDRVVAKEVRFRYVIDNSTLPKPGA